MHALLRRVETELRQFDAETKTINERMVTAVRAFEAFDRRHVYGISSASPSIITEWERLRAAADALRHEYEQRSLGRQKICTPSHDKEQTKAAAMQTLKKRLRVLELRAEADRIQAECDHECDLLQCLSNVMGSEQMPFHPYQVRGVTTVEELHAVQADWQKA